jgi:hypothetical protein
MAILLWSASAFRLRHVEPCTVARMTFAVNPQSRGWSLAFGGALRDSFAEA